MRETHDTQPQSHTHTIHAHTDTYTHTLTYLHTYRHRHTQTHMCNDLRTRIGTDTCTDMKQTQTPMGTYTHAHIQPYAQRHTHIHSPSRVQYCFCSNRERGEATVSLTVCRHNDQVTSLASSPREEGRNLARSRSAAECCIQCHGLHCCNRVAQIVSGHGA